MGENCIDVEFGIHCWRSLLADWEGDAFVFEQPCLSPDFACVAYEGVVGSDDAVAGEDDGDGVFIVGSAHCARGVWVSDLNGYLAVGSRLAEGDGCKLGPD